MMPTRDSSYSSNKNVVLHNIIDSQTVSKQAQEHNQVVGLEILHIPVETA